MQKFHLAQVNLAHLKAPMDSDLLRGPTAHAFTFKKSSDAQGAAQF